jgi:hypothetical protein
MQEHAYPASNEPLIFSKIMVGILDDDVIEVRILYRLYHTGILIKVLDRGKVAPARRGRGSAPLRSARVTRIARAASASASRMLSAHCCRPRAASEQRPPNHALTTCGKNVFSKAKDRPYPALSRPANSSHS